MRSIALPLILLLVATGLLTWQITNLISAARWLDHSDKVMEAANHVYRLMVDLETGQRGYLITGEPLFLQPYQVAGPQVQPAFERLRALVADSPSQLERVDHLIHGYHNWLELPELEPTKRAGVSLLAQMATRKGTMDLLREDFEGLLETETRVRDQRAIYNESWAFRLVVFTVVLLVSMGWILAWTGRRNLRVLSVSYENQVAQGDRALRRQQDLTDDLRRSNTELDQYAYIASHDLKEPLRMITSYMGLLKMRYRDKLDGEAIRYVDFATEGATRLHQLLTDLLNYSQLESKPPKIAPVEMRTVAVTAIQHLQEAIRETAAEVHVGDLPTIWGDSLQLILVLQNLIANGIKFRRPGVAPQIEVTSARLADSWEFRVRDNGIGIDPEYFHRLFVIFHRLHSRDEYPGSGIGLAMCKRVVERHRGKIWVESTVGAGSTFVFTLPATSTASESG